MIIYSTDDQTIVKLLPLADDDEDDTTFINANYIPVSELLMIKLNVRLPLLWKIYIGSFPFHLSKVQ